MKKIGLVTWTGMGNFGTILQAYALYSFLKSCGYDCSIINEFDPDNFGIKSYLKSIANSFGVLNLLERRRVLKWQDSKKYLKVLDFRNKAYKFKKIYSSAQYKRMLDDIDVFCSGSDQIWNAYYNFNPFNFLNFAGENKRISYASSIGTKDFPKDHEQEIKNMLLDFSHISLREETGRIAVENLTGRKDTRVVLDPTFLLTKDDWSGFGRKGNIEINVPERFIFVYLIGNNKEYENQLKDLSRRIGIENMIMVPATENPNLKIDGAIEYRFASPYDFVSLIEQSSWVCTDSFHATALSINLNKNFTEFLRFKDNDKGSQNSRLYDVLQTYNLQDRLYDKEKDAWAREINFTHPTEILKELRKDSTKWLINAIEN